MTFKPEDLPFACTNAAGIPIGSNDHEELVGYVNCPGITAPILPDLFRFPVKMGVLF